MTPAPPSNDPNERNERNDDITRAAKAAAILGAIFAVVALALFGFRPFVSVLIGAAIAVANLVTMRAIIRALLVVPPEDDAEDANSNATEDKDANGTANADEDTGKAVKTPAEHKSAGRRGGVAWGIFAVLKILILFGGVWILLTRGLVDPMPLVVGYGVLPLGIAASSLWSSLRPGRR